MYFFAFLPELLPAGFPLHSELPVPACETVMCKSEEVKCLCFLSDFLRIFLRVSAKFYQAAFAFLHFQPKVPHSLDKVSVKEYCIFLVLKACYKIICIYYQPCVSL